VQGKAGGNPQPPNEGEGERGEDFLEQISRYGTLSHGLDSSGTKAMTMDGPYKKGTGIKLHSLLHSINIYTRSTEARREALKSHTV